MERPEPAMNGQEQSGKARPGQEQLGNDWNRQERPRMARNSQSWSSRVFVVVVVVVIVFVVASIILQHNSPRELSQKKKIVMWGSPVE